MPLWQPTNRGIMLGYAESYTDFSVTGTTPSTAPITVTATAVGLPITIAVNGSLASIGGTVAIVDIMQGATQLKRTGAFIPVGSFSLFYMEYTYTPAPGSYTWGFRMQMNASGESGQFNYSASGVGPYSVRVTQG